MIVNAPGVVLSRRAFGEYDRLCTVFTEQFGKVPCRFVGEFQSGVWHVALAAFIQLEGQDGRLLRHRAARGHVGQSTS